MHSRHWHHIRLHVSSCHSCLGRLDLADLRRWFPASAGSTSTYPRRGARSAGACGVNSGSGAPTAVTGRAPVTGALSMAAEQWHEVVYGRLCRPRRRPPGNWRTFWAALIDVSTCMFGCPLTPLFCVSLFHLCVGRRGQLQDTINMSPHNIISPG